MPGTMIDRMDIDALLVGALYGELTPADAARLTAHLESHPADRTALADLTRTRATFRDSRILAVQFEPPQSVSALLLQEAARRAPRMAREPSEGWFQRFTRSFLAHPAMAAATMLVLVAGVAGTIYMRGGGAFTNPQSLPATSAPAGESPSPSVASDQTISTGNGAAPTAGDTVSGSAAYRVGLEEGQGQAKQDTPAGAVATQNDKQNDKQKVARDDVAEPSAVSKDVKPAPPPMADRKEEAEAPREPEPMREPAKPARQMAKLGTKPSGPSGIELRSHELMPKDLDDENQNGRDGRDAVTRDLGRARGADAVATVNEHARAGAGAPGSGGAANTDRPAGMVAAQPRPITPPAAPSAAPDPSAAAGNAPSAGSKPKASVAAAKPTPPASVALEQAPSQAPPRAEPPPPPRITADQAAVGRDSRRLAKGAPAADTKAARLDDKSAEDKVLLGWAQKQRDQVIAFVRSNNCRAAANTATEIYNRAPDYYAANVATDRSVKPCLAYLNSEREREDRSRASQSEERTSGGGGSATGSSRASRSKAASKPAQSSDAPAAAAPAPPPARK